MILSPRMTRAPQIVGPIARVALTKGHEAIVDADMADVVGHFVWHASVRKHTVYAATGHSTKKLLHRVIASAAFGDGALTGMEIDHVNRNGLDNRRDNLRIVTRSQNMCNAKPRKMSASGYRGVTWSKAKSKWLAQIQLHGKKRHVGFYDDPKEAADAYERARAELHGGYAIKPSESEG